MATQTFYENEEDQGLFTNRSTMMANFEEWIKMATDNKINSRNSWNFALIDYFHDLNVLRDSENNINFQKASATLDGCVKIYSSRVDSVTTETGKLLSGLAQRKNKQGNGDGGNGNIANGEGNDEDEEEEIIIDPATGLPISNDPDAHSKRRVYNRVLETTLVEFDAIRMKTFDKELSIDPLFKKALVDFDEGGAKSLLLNTLSIDNSSRVVFDAAIKEPTFVKLEEVPIDDLNTDKVLIQESSFLNDSFRSRDELGENNSVILEDEILALGMDFIKFDKIVNCEVSPSIQHLRDVVADINQAKTFIDGVNNKVNNFLSEEEMMEAIPNDKFNMDEEVFDINNDFIDDDGMEMNDDENNNLDGSGFDQGSIRDISDVGNSSMGNIFEQDLLSYFDETLKRTWRGRDHWKVRNFKKKHQLSTTAEATTYETENVDADGSDQENGEVLKFDRKGKKKHLELDFFKIDEDLEDLIFAPRQRKVIEIPLKSRVNDSHHLLPNDYHFSTDKITRLFIKPLQKMSLFKIKNNKRSNINELYMNEDVIALDDDAVPEIADEQFWADNYDRKEQAEQKDSVESEVNGVELENPFEDDNGIDFNQAFDDDDDNNIDNNDNETPLNNNNEEFGILPLKINRVSYSRVAKKVDVKRLKDNLWKSINILKDKYKETDSEATSIGLKFSNITNEMSKMYGEETRKDLSTSFCFICLLHLCNEHGLMIQNIESFKDLIVIYNQ